MKYYLLDENKRPYEVSATESLKAYRDPNMKIVKQDKVDDIFVSTVFLSMDHSWGDNDGPILFETMIFGGKHDEFQRRYKTYDEAVKGHNEALQMVTKSVNN